MKIAVLPQDDKSRSKPFYSLLVGLGYTQCIIIDFYHCNTSICCHTIRSPILRLHFAQVQYAEFVHWITGDAVDEASRVTWERAWMMTQSKSTSPGVHVLRIHVYPP